MRPLLWGERDLCEAVTLGEGVPLWGPLLLMFTVYISVGL